ncbi:MAG: putative transposase [Proteobacteria bacterium]|nr:putative transposase [Pseudomonadota bacterium]
MKKPRYALCDWGFFISGSGVRSVWLRHNLENFKKRLKALEEKVARDGIELTDSQIAALERKASDDEACVHMNSRRQLVLLVIVISYMIRFRETCE